MSNYNEYVCTSFAPQLKMIGNIVLILRIVIPLIILYLSVRKFAKNLGNANKKEKLEETLKLSIKIIICYFVYILPNIVISLFTFVYDISPVVPIYKNPIDYYICKSCLNNGLGKECSGVARCVSNLETNDEEQLEECYKCYNNPDLEQCSKQFNNTMIQARN